MKKQRFNVELLERRRKRLINELLRNMDFLVGSISSKGLKCEAYNLTTKIDGVTRSKHIPKDRIEMTRRLTKRHQKVKGLLKELSQVNWSLVCAGEDLCKYELY